MEEQNSRVTEINTPELLVQTNQKNSKPLLVIILVLLAFSLGILLTVVYFTYIRVTPKSSDLDIQPLAQNTSVSTTISTSSSALITSISSSATKIIYRDYDDKYVVLKVPVASTIEVNTDTESDGKKSFYDLTLKYRTFELYLGNGFCIDTNCEAHFIDYDLNKPLQIPWNFENEVSDAEGMHTVTRNGTYTLKEVPIKYTSEDGNYLYLYSEEFKNIDNKQIGNFLVFIKKDGKYQAVTSAGRPSFFNTLRGRNDYYMVTPNIKSVDDFNTTSEILQNIFSTFNIKRD